MTSFQKSAAVSLARKKGWTDEEILRSVLQNVYGAPRRREVVVEWAAALNLEPSEALRKARVANLLPTSAPPRASGKEKPPRKTPGKTS